MTPDSFTQAMLLIQQGLQSQGPPRGAARSLPTQNAVTEKGDWLEMTPGSSVKDLLPLPRGLRFCAHHAIKGLTCGLSRCTYGHSAYTSLPADQKKLLDDRLTVVNQQSTKFKVVP
jgi:hypothetical protein